MYTKEYREEPLLSKKEIKSNCLICLAGIVALSVVLGIIFLIGSLVGTDNKHPAEKVLPINLFSANQSYDRMFDMDKTYVFDVSDF